MTQHRYVQITCPHCAAVKRVEVPLGGTAATNCRDCRNHLVVAPDGRVRVRQPLGVIEGGSTAIDRG